MIDISGIRFQFTSSTGLYLSLLFPYEVFVLYVYLSSSVCGWILYFPSFFISFYSLLPDSEIYRPSYTFSSYKKTDSFLSVCDNVWIWKMFFLFHLQILFPVSYLIFFSHPFGLLILIRETHLTVRWIVPPFLRFFWNSLSLRISFENFLCSLLFCFSFFVVFIIPDPSVFVNTFCKLFYIFCKLSNCI